MQVISLNRSVEKFTDSQKTLPNSSPRLRLAELSFVVIATVRYLWIRQQKVLQTKFFLWIGKFAQSGAEYTIFAQFTNAVLLEIIYFIGIIILYLRNGLSRRLYESQFHS